MHAPAAGDKENCMAVTWSREVFYHCLVHLLTLSSCHLSPLTYVTPISIFLTAIPTTMPAVIPRFPKPKAPTVMDCKHSTRQLLDILDKLRQHELDLKLDLPRLVVFGDQSSGKSSVLEAIVQMKLPKKDTLCTRFAIELFLRSADTVSWSAEIIPHKSCTELQKKEYAEFGLIIAFKVKNPHLEIATIVEEAAKAMGIGGRTGATFSRACLRIKLQGPDLLDLDVVDTPGLYHGDGEEQSAQDAPMIREIAEEYMNQQSTIIVAIVSARHEIGGQQVTALARTHDPQRLRTLGILTKPDSIEGENQANQFVRLVQNKIIDPKLKLGWHVLKNPSWNQGQLTHQERVTMEQSFLAGGIWAQVEQNDKGIIKLGEKLMTIYRQHIVGSYTGLRRQIEEEIHRRQSQLRSLAPTTATDADGRGTLQGIANGFAPAISLAMEGHADRSQTDPSSEELRLRGVVEDLIRSFADSMRARGHTSTILDEALVTDVGSAPTTTPISFEDFTLQVASQVQPSQIPAQFDARMTTQLFGVQTQGWAPMLDAFVRDVGSALSRCTQVTLRRFCHENAAKAIDSIVIDPILVQIHNDFLSEARKQLPLSHNGMISFTNETMSTAILRAEARYIATTVTGRNGQGQAFGRTGRVDLQHSLEKSIDLSQLTVYKAVECMRIHYKVRMDLSHRPDMY